MIVGRGFILKFEKFEILSNNVIKEVDLNIKCIPPIATLTQMSKNGYVFRLNGKIISLKDVKKYLNENHR